MTQSEFLEKKQDGLKECKAYYTNEFLKEFDSEMAQYLKTRRSAIAVESKYYFRKKEALAIIASKYPHLKLKVKIGWIQDYQYTARYPHIFSYRYYYFTPKRKFTIFGREVWI